MSLPERSGPAEDAWVAGLRDADAPVLEDAVRAALAAGRPRLAGRLVGLLADSWGRGDPELERARKAAHLLLVEAPEGPDRAGELLVRLRRRRMERARRRQRRRVARAEGRKPGGRSRR